MKTKRPRTKKIKVTESSGNVFVDLGFPPDEAQGLVIRSELMLRVRDVIQSRKLTQAEAAKVFGVTQPRVSDLVRGRIDKFSIDMLITMLVRAGLSVRVDVKPRAA
jgi:predicted XRE-type DNA-binding protein